jgi:hypothetical protein
LLAWSASYFSFENRSGNHFCSAILGHIGGINALFGKSSCGTEKFIAE